MNDGTDEARRLARLEKDMYFGNGKPAVTIRLQQLEDAQETTTNEVHEMKEDIKGIRADNRKTMLMIGGVFLTVLGEILVRVLFK